ncbi:hypothetical protein NliqN6_0083 [Naganishia liquefaciens]|uniref:Protein ZIP4 homolog n=1 Tax=Naganishia liquefaciens TaxID=104408 RepID=A0A8H3YDD3_9TREE|nr:hypothetical protein NliqN6_0083 [Naganishia liquefaciens]
MHHAGPHKQPPNDFGQAYQAILGLVQDANRNLDDLRLETDAKRPDILPGIPQGILPILRRIVDQSQAFKTILRASVKGKEPSISTGGPEKGDAAGKKRRREGMSNTENAVAGPMERQAMRDNLDQEGTNLWNRTLPISRLIKTAKEAPIDVKDRSRMQLRQEAFENWDRLFAHCKSRQPASFARLTERSGRYAAYSLVQVSGDDRTDPRMIMRNLELATKTSVALYAARDSQGAGEIMSIAAELENLLSNMLVEGSHGLSDDSLQVQEARRNVVDYYMARCTLEVDRDNENMAETLMKSAIDHCTASAIATRSIQAVIRKCAEIGHSLLSRITNDKSITEADSNNALHAGRWLSKGLQMLDSKEGTAEIAQCISQFKLPLLENLARASILSADKDDQALDRAQTITDDLLKSTDLSRHRSQVQSFLVINLDILRRRKSSSQDVSKILERIIDLVDWQNEENVTRTLAEIADSSMAPKEATANYAYLLRAASKDAGDGRNTFAPRILLAFVIHLQKQEDPFPSAQELHKVLDTLAAVDEFRLEPSQAIAIGTIIWKAADRLSQTAGAKSFAAQWFLAGAHPVFNRATGPRSSDKWRRRAVLCYLAIKDYANAEAQLWSCDPADADTLYLQFALSIATDQENQACEFAKKLGKASNCSEGHLTLAMQSAAESQLAAVTKTVLRVLLSCKVNESPRNSNKIGLIRALIRMYLKDVDTSASSSAKTIAEILDLYKQALDICRKLESQGDLALHAKDTAWLYKSLFNLSLDGLNRWSETEHIVEGFTVAVEMMEIYKRIPGAEVDPDLGLQIIRGVHASLCGNVFAARETADEGQRANLWRNAEGHLHKLKAGIKDAAAVTATAAKAAREIRLHAYILEVEILGRLQRFDEIQEALESIDNEAIPMQVCEAVADLSFEKGLPVKVTLALQNLALKVAFKANNAFDILRWSRSVIELLIHRHDGDDLENALSHVQKAKEIADNHKEEVRDSDEVEWLLATSWNQGLDLLNLSNATCQAKSWLETALSFCSLVKKGEERMNHMRKIYNNVLAKQ